MSDLRHDPINNQWVSIARNRRERPTEFVPLEQARQQIVCPFCKGNEDETPPALAAYRRDGSQLSTDDDPSSWMVRVVPNLYPSFSKLTNGMGTNQENDAYECSSTGEVLPYHVNHSPGHQELIIPSRRHVTSLSELNDEELAVSFQAYQDRIRWAKSLDGIKHTMLFMNCRLAAGATLGHIHSQLIGAPVVSSRLESRVQRNACHEEKHGCSLIESLIEWEIQQEDRIVELTKHFCIVCPFASKFAYQVWIVPRSSEFDLENCSGEVRNELALHCRTIISRFETLQEDMAYNILYHTPSTGSQNGSKTSQSFFELFPRVTRAAGFEWGTDIWVNPVSPESAARRLRSDG